MNPKQLLRNLLPKKASRAAEETYRRARLFALQVRYGFPARHARVIAVTGTNGKTTTCLLINEMLKKAGRRTAMLTTAVNELNGEAKPNLNHRTVPLTADLLHFFKRAKQAKVDFIVLEVTSQALHQHKLAAIPVEVAVLTNLTQDHLDYHGSMQQYAAAKARLFNSYMQPQSCVLNRDSDWFDYFADQAAGRVVSYGQASDSTLHIQKITAHAGKTEVKASYSGRTIRFDTALPGAFNAYNASAAALVGLQLGLSSAEVKAGVAALNTAPGRMERVEAGQKFEVIVDYAHTPDALQNVLQALQNVTKGRVLIVFGATGSRDKAKRPIMGEVVAHHADKIFLTDDETYAENPASIRAAVMKGIEKAGGTKKTQEIGDRRAAIQAAFQSANPDDTVLLAGIGHQNYRVMNSKKEPWDERDVARGLLKLNLS